MVRDSLVGLEPPWTHVKLLPRPGFVCCNINQTGSEYLELPQTDVKLHHMPGILWFKQVRMSRTTPNSWEIILLSLELSGSSKFGRVEPPRSHVKLHLRADVVCCNMIQTGLEELNHPKLMRNYPMILVPSRTQYRFERVEPPQTREK